MAPTSRFNMALLFSLRLSLGAAAGHDAEAAAVDAFSRVDEPFLGRASATRPTVRRALEETLKSQYRADTEDRLQRLEAELRPTYIALPKTEFGYVGGAAVRYLLHRYFIRSRAWLVKGLAPTGEPWAVLPSPTLVLRDGAPGSVRELFERRLARRGLSLHEVSVLAAMIENQVHKDSVRRLRRAWVSETPSSGDIASRISLKEAEEALDMYMASYVLQSNDYFDRRKFAAVDMVEVYPGWKFAQSFVRTHLQLVAGNASDVSFAALEQVVVEVSEHFGRYQATDCDDLKNTLLKYEGPVPGQVSINNFYWLVIKGGMFQFSESIGYLREVGALDERSREAPMVIIANYVESPSQLVASSDDYSITCLDECEDLLSKIEMGIASPEALPDQLAELVASIASRTTPARNATGLPETLTRRLHEIAGANAGAVPLHGRLFAQFLHHAFPRECPYPHRGGRHHFLLPDEYDEAVHHKHSMAASHSEMARYSRRATVDTVRVEKDEAALPWDVAEELVAPIVQQRKALLPEAVTSGFQLTAGMTVLALVLSNLAMTQSMKKVGVSRLERMFQLRSFSSTTSFRA
eukprot:TRINITY_DN14228_c0_g3_i1.p1 TRINITY_DN14228_c0_g3~~TRINITY_DN14228_c0_g3_i1.p1  ORF type:complete len:580 (-),score=128.93 TRINITY_DN14228_c0_g3_i1:64-1803(-)